MIKHSRLLALAPLLLVGAVWAQRSQAQQPQQQPAPAPSEYPLMEKVAARVIQKYETSTCVQLATEKSQEPAGKKAEIEQRAIELLKSDPKMRKAFLDRVAAPIANKLFECGMIP